MRDGGVRLWSMMVAIAILAIPLGLGAARGIDDRSNLIEMIEIYESDRAIGLTESWRVWIKVNGTFLGKLTGPFIRPEVVGPGDHGKKGVSEFYLVKVEYAATAVIGLVTILAIALDYLRRQRQRRAGAERGAGGSVG